MKQAVVIIHGIGEQLPMSTLRGFAAAVLPSASNGKPQFYSKPDSASDLFELRRLQGANQGRTVTHLFEYYWAYQVEGTALTHLRTWLTSVLLRKPKNVPRHLFPLWLLSWLLVLLFAWFALAAVLRSPLVAGQGEGRGGLTSAVTAAVIGLLQYVLIYYVGDAARYLSPHPRNVGLRQTIRSNGVKLLRKLHESGEYERIVVVGHSLGSVIAYDILNHLWQEYHDVHTKPQRINQVAKNELELAGQMLLGRESTVTITDFQKKQHVLWKEQRSLGNPWLITDLITLGSPLAHAVLLLAKGESDLKNRQLCRELPTSPPAYEGKHISFVKRPPYEVNGQKVSLFVLHHAAVFACTRWTNLFFPAKFGLFGDFVGGPLAPVFGKGVRDCPLDGRLDLGILRYTPFAHTHYWRTRENVDALQPGGENTPLNTLRKALDL